MAEKTIGDVLIETADIPKELKKPAKLFRPRRKINSWKRSKK